MWSYVQSKANPRWLWHAIDHHTGTVLAYGFGRRQDTVFLTLKALLEPFGITRYFTDGWRAYERHVEVMPLDDLLRTFQQQHAQLALVVNEYGSVEGLVTLEDVIEELVGEVHDALEAAQPSLQHLLDGRVLVRGEVRLRELNDQLGWDMQDEDVATMAGSILHAALVETF